jgi:hypothetical protein
MKKACSFETSGIISLLLNVKTQNTWTPKGILFQRVCSVIWTTVPCTVCTHRGTCPETSVSEFVTSSLQWHQNLDKSSTISRVKEWKFCSSLHSNSLYIIVWDLGWRSQAKPPRIIVGLPVGESYFFLRRQDQLYDPPSLLISVYRGKFPGVKLTEAWSLSPPIILLLLQWIGVSGVIPPV